MIEGFGGMTDEALRLSLIFGLTSGSIFVVYKKWSTFYISILAGIFLLFSKAGVNTMGFYVFLNCFFFIPFLREAVITKPLLKLINVKKALSKVSETEKVAINAGGTWVDKDLFSGSPDLSKILSYKIQKLTKEEQDFLDNQTNKVCSMVSDWDVFESKDTTDQKSFLFP